uniref:Rho related BTB domain containing 3 n=1 Tax=Bos indicus x Bos taurus TaxID=30522 RepID=A0A4W2CYA9_BOBOX
SIGSRGRNRPSPHPASPPPLSPARLRLQLFELNKLAAGGLVTGSSRAGASYLLIYIPRRPARAVPLYPARRRRRCPGSGGSLSGERGPRVRPKTPPPPPPRPARAAAARPAERGGGPASPPPAAEPEARGAAAGRSAGKARRPASLRGGGGGPAAGTAGPPAPGCAPALPDWLAARTRPPELARPPALRRPRRAGGARGGGDATRDELIAGGRAWWWWGAETTPPPGPCRPRGADLSPRRRPAPGDWRSCTYASGARSGLQPRRVPCAPPRARGALARPSSPRAVPRAHHAPLLPPGLGRLRSIHIVALGNEGDAFHQDSRPSGLIRAYLGRSPLVSGDESSLLLSASGAAARPVFTEYQASAFGNVKLVVHDCPVWDIFDSDWYTSRNLIGGADIIVIKYNVNDKFSFHEVKDNYIPVIKRALNSVPVIIAAVGTRQNGAFQWEELEDDIRKKLKDSGDVSNVIEKVKCILKTPGKFNCLRNCKTYQARKPLWFYNTSLKFFLNKPMLADVVFEIQGTTVPAHRAILVARCEVMAAMFNGNYMEAKSVLIPVYGVSKETFLSFLEYLYTDSCCPAGIFQAMCLLICAEMYQVSRLQHICELFIITQLQSMPSRELASMNLDIVDLLKKAKFHHSDCLSTWLLHFIATNYLIFSQKPEFQDLSGHTLGWWRRCGLGPAPGSWR